MSQSPVARPEVPPAGVQPEENPLRGRGPELRGTEFSGTELRLPGVEAGSTFVALRMPKAEEPNKGAKGRDDRRAPERDALVERSLRDLPATVGRVDWRVEAPPGSTTLIVLREVPFSATGTKAEQQSSRRVSDQVEKAVLHLQKDLKVDELLLTGPRTRELAAMEKTVTALATFANAHAAAYNVKDLATTRKEIELEKKEKPPNERTLRDLGKLVDYYTALEGLTAERERSAAPRLAADGKVTLANSKDVPKGDSLCDRVNGPRGYVVAVVDGSRDVRKEVEAWNKKNPNNQIALVEVTPEQYPRK